MDDPIKISLHLLSKQELPTRQTGARRRDL